VIAGVADTHAAHWYLLNAPRLSANARQFMTNAANAGAVILLSSISLVEIVYLVEKGRLPFSAYEDLKAAIYNPHHVLKEAPLNSGIVESMRKVPRADVPDMPDRIVAATAVYYGVPIISRDGCIRTANLQTVW
jgi:PIN domain nuclease of toxin-antitoxin system